MMTTDEKRNEKLLEKLRDAVEQKRDELGVLRRSSILR